MTLRAAMKVLVAATVLWPAAVSAQTYPSRPIVMVVPFAAGGTFDVMGRIMSVRMSELLGQQIVVENTSGAGGIVGVNRVVNAAPDGYTLLLGSTGTHAHNQTIYKKRRYDAETRHGLLADQQAAWSRTVNLRLDRLRAPS